MRIILKSVLSILSVVMLTACGAGKLVEEVNFVDREPVQKIPSPILKMETDLVLVFSKTMGWRHKSIEKGVNTLKYLGLQNDFVVTHTEDSLAFNTNNLKKYRLVIFLNTTLDILGDEQEAAFEEYIQNGGSFMGIHAAADTEYEWPWYNKLVGAYFLSHPSDSNVRKATVQVVDKNHLSTSFLPDNWVRTDEWYNYKSINTDLNVLMKLDESTYEGGANGNNHPIAWYHEYDGGRAFYTGGGHTQESYDEPDFQKHLVGGIKWCLDRK